MANQTSSIRSDFYVYALCRGNTGEPFYIGKGRGTRWAFHEWEALAGAPGHKCNTIRAMCARGIEVIRTKLHEDLTEATARAYEIALIAAIGRRPVGPLVNPTDGGDGVTGIRHTIESLAKMSAAKIGKKLSPESIEKRSVAVRGKKRSAETVEKVAAAQRGKGRRKMTPEEIAKRSASVRGSKRSSETRERMSQAQRGRRLSPEQCAQISKNQRGRKHTPEHIAKCIAARTGGKRTVEARDKMRIAALAREAAKRAAKAGPHRRPQSAG
jgi:hypothetical protein